jgi:hypothetical protein
MPVWHRQVYACQQHKLIASGAYIHFLLLVWEIAANDGRIPLQQLQQQQLLLLLTVGGLTAS